MNPLFVAHLVADFLLQPTWLVKLKQHSRMGIYIHAAIHALVMTLLTVPQGIMSVSIVMMIAVSHGIIDYAKIHYQKKNVSFEKGFILDQLAHLTIIFLASFMLRTPMIWRGEAGKGILILLTFLSFSMGWFNLSRSSPVAHERFKRLMLILGACALFIVPAMLLAHGTLPLL